MRISIFTLLSVAICGLVTSCIPPYPPNFDPTLQQPVDPQAEQKEEQLLNSEAQKQLEEARNNLGPLPEPQNQYNDLPNFNQQPVAPKPVKPGYQYATKVPGKPGFVFNPWTKNQVDVRGIPSGTLVRDPYDDDKTHKFRVP